MLSLLLILTSTLVKPPLTPRLTTTLSWPPPATTHPSGVIRGRGTPTRVCWRGLR